ncbi:PASTA domain-containing protein, partial [Nonomuraea mesophila]
HPHSHPQGAGSAAGSRPQPAPAHTLIQPRTEVPQGRGFRPNWFLVTLAAVMAVAVGLTGWYFSQSDPVIVPDLVGKDMAIAEKNAAALGLVVRTGDGEHDEKVAAGLVLRTDPAAKSEVDDGTTITLVPSLGPKRVIVPNVAGMTENDARVALADADLTVDSVKRLANKEVERDKVIRTSPQVGEKVKQGAKIDVFVSAGLVMPDVGGMPKDQAAGHLSGQGFQVQVNEVDDDAEPCTVIAQEPKAKAEVDNGAQVMITVARCQTDFWDWFGDRDGEGRDDRHLRVVPGVLGKELRDARSELQALGFSVRVQRLVNAGVVKYQRPLPNSERPSGSTVYLWQ